MAALQVTLFCAATTNKRKQGYFEFFEELLSVSEIKEKPRKFDIRLEASQEIV